MSVEAAKAFDISQADLLRFLDLKKSPETIAPAIKISEHSKHVILIVSIFLFVLALLTCGCTLCLWLVSKRKKDDYEQLKDMDKADLACDDEALKDAIKGSPTLPQMSEKPKIDPSAIYYPEKEALEEEELHKLRLESLEVTSNFYVHRSRLQVNVKRVELSSVDDELSQNAYIYLVVSLLPEKSAFFESELRPVAEANFFEEVSEFDLDAADITSRNLKVAVYACDRFSQHRLVNEYTYNLFVSELEEAEGDAKPSIVPVNLNEVSRSPDNEAPEKESHVGEVLFSLCYMPTSGRLTFVALKGRNISDEKEIPLATYLRVSLLVLGKTMKTVQTSSVRRSSAPVYNEAFVFHTPLERIKDTDIVVSVMSYVQAPEKPKMLGKIIVGPKAEHNLGRKHWEAMLTSPRKPIAQWHSLVDSL